MPAPHYRGRTYTHTIILHYQLTHSQSLTIPGEIHKTDWGRQLYLLMRARECFCVTFSGKENQQYRAWRLL